MVRQQGSKACSDEAFSVGERILHMHIRNSGIAPQSGSLLSRSCRGARGPARNDAAFFARCTMHSPHLLPRPTAKARAETSQQFNASLRGKKGLKSSRDENARHEPQWGGGEERSLLCDPGSELRIGGREKKKGEDNKWDGKKRGGASARPHYAYVIQVKDTSNNNDNIITLYVCRLPGMIRYNITICLLYTSPSPRDS